MQIRYAQSVRKVTPPKQGCVASLRVVREGGRHGSAASGAATFSEAATQTASGVGLLS